MGTRDEDAQLAPAVWKPLGLCKKVLRLGLVCEFQKISTVYAVLLLPGVRSICKHAHTQQFWWSVGLTWVCTGLKCTGKVRKW